MFINGLIVISLLACLMFGYGLLIFLFDYKENKCEMTYMFQYPQFVKIPQDADDEYKKYGLHVYSEGRFTERARNMHFTGIPVLFIPGNAGSHKQVRSLASVALRKSLDIRPGFHFDFFTLDLNNELTGFCGDLLQKQLEYANHSIYRILELYKTKPASMVLIGHSMGGIIAESLLNTLPEKSLIPLVITLAAPHKRLPIVFELSTDLFYENIAKTSNPFQETTFVSLAGGYEDFLVPTVLTEGGKLNAVTTHVPRVWLSVDHLCILWCKQLVLTLNRALFDSVDTKTKQISMEPDYRRIVFYHHFVRNSGAKMYLSEKYPKMIDMDSKGEWIEYLPRQYSIYLSQGTKQIRWYMMRFVNQPRHEILTMLAVNLDVIDWVYACSAIIIQDQSRKCKEGIYLSHMSELVPSIKFKRRLIEINLHHLQSNFSYLSHVVTKILPTSEPVTLHVDIHGAGERIIPVALPNRFSFKTETIIEETAMNAITYKLELPDLFHITQPYELFVNPIKCKTQTHQATAALIVPWTNQNTYASFTETDNQPMDIRLHTSKPNWLKSSPYIKLILDPECRYKISIKTSVPHVFSQLARFYSPFLIANVVAVVLLTLRHQLINFHEKGTCPLFFISLKTAAAPYYILPVVKMTTEIRSLNMFLTTILPKTDWHTLQEEGMNFFVLPFFLYLVSVGFVWFTSVFFSISLLFFESTTVKFLTRALSGSMALPDVLMKILQKIPGLYTLMLILISLSTCGGLAICLATVFYFLKLSYMSHDLLEEVIIKVATERGFKKRNNHSHNLPPNLENSSNGSNNSENPASTSTASSVENHSKNILRDIALNNNIFFHYSVFALFFLVMILNLPSVITWAHNFRYSPKLENDPSLLPGIILSTCGFAMWQFELPKVNKKWYKVLGFSIYFVAVISLLYGLIRVYLLNYMLTWVICIVTLHQLLAPDKSNEPQSEGESRPGVKEFYDEAKRKMD